MTLMRFASFPIAALPLLLAACGAAPRHAVEADPVVVGSVGEAAQPVPADNAFIRLSPAAGAVREVREQTYANGVSQRIMLAGDAANRMDVSIRVDGARQAATGIIPMQKPTQEGIRLELAERFPSVQMQVVARPMRNTYGPFGLAIGRGAGETRCIYAWQWIDDAGDLRSSNASVFKKLGAVTGNAAPASLRLRLCREGVTVDHLASAMSGIVVSRSAKALANEPLARAEGHATRSLESEIAPPPSAAPLVAAVAPQKPRARPAKPKDETARAPSAPRRAPPAPTYMPDHGHGPRYLAPVGPAQPTAPQGMPSPVPPPPAAAPSAPRIPAPQAQPPAPQVRIVPLPAKKTLDPSLPAAAYRGPGTTTVQ